MKAAISSNKLWRVADADIARHRIGGQHHPHGDEEKGRVDQADDDRDLKQIEKYFELYASAPMGVWKEEHHQNRSAIEGVKQSARRFRQEGLPEHRAEDLQDCGNSQDHQHDAEQNQNSAVTPWARRNAIHVQAMAIRPCSTMMDSERLQPACPVRARGSPAPEPRSRLRTECSRPRFGLGSRTRASGRCGAARNWQPYSFSTRRDTLAQILEIAETPETS